MSSEDYLKRRTKACHSSHVCVLGGVFQNYKCHASGTRLRSNRNLLVEESSNQCGTCLVIPHLEIAEASDDVNHLQSKITRNYCVLEVSSSRHVKMTSITSASCLFAAVAYGVPYDIHLLGIHIIHVSRGYSVL